MIRLIPLIEHLQSPVRWGAIHISRYSPYHTDPEHYGITNIRAFPVYHELFGRSAELVAHNFDADYRSAWDMPDLVARFDATCERWVRLWTSGAPPVLEVRTAEGGSPVVIDTRPVAKIARYSLNPTEIGALETVRSATVDGNVPEKHQSAIEKLVDLGFVVHYEGKYLSLIAEPEIGERLQNERKEIVARRSGDSRAMPASA